MKMRLSLAATPIPLGVAMAVALAATAAPAHADSAPGIGFNRAYMDTTVLPCQDFFRFANGAWYGGSPYLGPDATLRATGCTSDPYIKSNQTSCGQTGSTPPSGTIANSPSGEAGFAFMWHSHNEREITTNNIFPGGMLMMMLVDSREFPIDESM